MELNLKGKVAVVFGASSGIGAQTAIQFAQEGAVVYVIARRVSALEELCATISKAGGTAYAISADMGMEEEIVSALEQIRSKSGKIDILVNTAAITAQQMKTKDKIELFRTIIEVDLIGLYNVCRHAIPLIADGGSIVNFSSLAAYVGGIGQDNYTAAKAGISGLTRSLAVELASRNIRVNAVCPGFVDTPMTALSHSSDRSAALKLNPLHRAGKPSELADVVLFLSSERASFITGQVIHVNGGQYMG